MPLSSYSIYLASTFLTLTLATVIPFPPPSSPLPINQPANVLPIPSSWSLPTNAGFQNIEEFQQVKGFSPPTCDAAAYGRALRLESCREAQRMIPMDRSRLVFGVGLPAFGDSDEASAFDIAHAAWMIINTCVADFENEGGRMDGVGLHKRLPVYVASYDPHVRCSPPTSPPAPSFHDCDALIKKMRASKQLYDFGPQGWPHLDFVVPYVFSSREYKLFLSYLKIVLVLVKVQVQVQVKVAIGVEVAVLGILTDDGDCSTTATRMRAFGALGARNG
ncbi:MAG: hypothetical protein Q9215_002844 [Flavoplaca cf. flavocitrina]